MDAGLYKYQHVNDGLPKMQRMEQLEKHPVQVMEDMKLFANEEAQMKSYSKLYGSHLAFTLTMERTLIGNMRRGGGQKSTMLGLEILMDRMNELHPEDIFGNDDPRLPAVSAHEHFVRKLN